MFQSPMKNKDDNQNFEKHVQNMDHFGLSSKVKPMDSIASFACGVPFSQFHF